MKSHATNFTVGALLVPVALAIATAIANEAQTLLGLHLDNVALSIYLLPFLGGAAAAFAALLRLEAAKIGGEIGGFLGNLAGLFDAPPATSTPPEAPQPTFAASPATSTPLPPPPPPPPAP